VILGWEAETPVVDLLTGYLRVKRSVTGASHGGASHDGGSWLMVDPDALREVDVAMAVSGARTRLANVTWPRSPGDDLGRHVGAAAEVALLNVL